LKWRVYAFAQGDSLALWREQEFQMVQGGSVWVPPKMDDLRNVVAAGPETAGGSAAASAAVELTEAERDAFEDILRTLTVERSSIRAAMLFALDHAPAAAEISDTLIQALSLPETPVAVKVARLFLLSDVLHNSNAAQSNAAAYRSHLISRLPLVFESLHEAYSALDSRITAQELRRRVTSVLRAWAEWFMFGEHFLGGLEATFVGLRSSAASRLVDDASLRAALEALSAEDLERRCRDNGLSTLAGRDGCIARLLALDCFRRAQRGELPPEEQEEQQAPAEPHERGTWTVVSEPPASRWTKADAAPESEPAPRKRSRSPGADGSPRRSPRKW
jgi:U2-associated protein SR140